jgi:methionyl-tRNA formyltransferase
VALRIAFLGTAEFSVPSLRACLDAQCDVAAVVTQPDRPGDRGRPAPRPVADLARERGLPILQPPRIRDPEATAAVLALGVDALVVAAYGQILPVALLEGPRLGGVNVHASLLPRWRGASPVAAAILAGDAQTGVSIMRMEAGLDTGPVYAQRATAIGPAETAPQLGRRLAEMGAGLLVEVLAALERGGVAAWPQDDAAASLAPRLRREDGQLDWAAATAVEVDRRVRALDPWPGVTVPLGGAEVRLLAGEPLEREPGAAPGTVLRTAGEVAEVAAREGVYGVRRVQPPGRRPMDAAAYLRGRRSPARAR